MDDAVTGPTWGAAGRTVRWGLLAALLTAACGKPAGDAPEGPAGAGAAPTAPGVQVTDVLLTTPLGDAPAALYFTVSNGDPGADTVVAVETPAGAAAELHRNVQHGDLVHMESLPVLEVPGQGIAALAPGGIHVMLTGLRGDLQPGDSADVVVVLRRAGRIAVRARVVSYLELADVVGGDPASSHAGH